MFKITSMDYAAGQKASIQKEITDQGIRDFAALSGDFNPVHCDESYAAGTIFKKRIAHGLYIASFISTVLASKLPGPGSIYLSQELKFERPVYIGDIITAEVEIELFRKDKKMLTLATRCLNQHGKSVISGKAVVKVP